MQVGWRVGAQPVGATQNRSFPAPLNWPRTETGLNLAGEGRSAYTASWNRRGKTEIPVECLPFGPASCSASRSNSSPSALSPTCWTHSNSACLLRAIPSIIGSNSCCAVNRRPPPACLASRLFALFLIGASFPPRGRCCWHHPLLRPAWSRRYLFKFQHSGGHRQVTLEIVIQILEVSQIGVVTAIVDSKKEVNCICRFIVIDQTLYLRVREAL